MNVREPRLMPTCRPVLIAVLALLTFTGQTLAEARAQAGSTQGATEIPPELQGEPWRQITAQIEASRHEVRRVDGAWQAHTPAQDYRTEFTDAGPVFKLATEKHPRHRIAAGQH